MPNVIDKHRKNNVLSTDAANDECVFGLPKRQYSCGPILDHEPMWGQVEARDDRFTVRSVMTESSVQFLGAQTLAAVTGDHPVEGFWDEADVSPHTDLGQWADAMVIAPATAATIAKLATGLSDNVLIATALATEGPLVVAPAMHTEMWQNPATQRNVGRLSEDGVTFVGPQSGALAGGDTGPGRMAEPDEIVSALIALLAGSATDASERDMDGYKVLVTAGGTREPIDPVRYIGNRSRLPM